MRARADLDGVQAQPALRSIFYSHYSPLQPADLDLVAALVAAFRATHPGR